MLISQGEVQETAPHMKHVSRITNSGYSPPRKLMMAQAWTSSEPGRAVQWWV